MQVRMMSVVILHVEYVFTYSGGAATRNTNTVFFLLNPVIPRGYAHIQGQFIHKTGSIGIETRIPFLAPLIQHVGWC